MEGWPVIGFQSHAAKRDRRRAVPVMSYTGGNGHGKTFAMVADTIPSLDEGRPVLSTVRLRDFRKPRPCEDSSCSFPGHPEHGQAHPSWIPFVSWEQLLDLTDCDVLLDEITGSMSSRDTSSLPSIVGDEIQQMRRSDRMVRWTAPSYGLGDIQLRRVTQGLTVCKGRWGVNVPGRLWTQKREFRWKTYDINELMDDQVVGLTAAGRARSSSLADMYPIVREKFKRESPEGQLVMLAYDTYAPVLRLQIAGQSGRCLGCGGRITVPTCKCADPGGRSRRSLELVTGLVGDAAEALA